ncbi:MAG TPA: filamentous hemagglutinin N-terminal domain-containing protein, partial [Nitrospiraceae bacterium]|nr:filamentous hemagglutinin N-terminal domain-containing protein [Nitrospiraceae bacterium]
MSRNSSCNKPSLPLPLVIHILGILLLWLPHLLIADQAHAVVTTSITATPDTGNLSTTITQTGNLYDITGGTRPDGGTNLFHSFQSFSVGAGDIANFLNIGSFDLNGNLLADGLPTSNILVGVTGVNISNIYGTLQTSDFGSANLFLMNPHGFLFGPNATVNVGGMVAFTTAYYLRLEGTGGNGIFHADPLKTSM